MTLRDLVASGPACDAGSSSNAPLSRLTSSVLDAPLGRDAHHKPSQSRTQPSSTSHPFSQQQQQQQQQHPAPALPSYLTGQPPPVPPQPLQHPLPPLHHPQQSHHPSNISSQDFQSFLNTQNPPASTIYHPPPHAQPAPFLQPRMPPQNLPRFFPSALMYPQQSPSPVMPPMFHPPFVQQTAPVQASQSVHETPVKTDEQPHADVESVEVREEDLQRFVQDVGTGGSWGEEFTSLENGNTGRLDELNGAFRDGLRLGEDEATEVLPSVSVESRGVEGVLFGEEGRVDAGRGVVVLGRYELLGMEGMEDRAGLVEEAERLRERGEVAKAVRMAEEGLKKETDVWERVRGWFVVGLSQAECDEDVRALEAFRECVEVVDGIQGNDEKKMEWMKKVLVEMAVSYTNELDEINAVSTLTKWLQVASGNAIDDIHGIVDVSDVSGTIAFPADKLAERMEQMIESGSCKADMISSMYVALGVLRNLTRDYDKAAVAFRHAIAEDPRDARLWNKLGATLANGFEASEALRAYRKAVELSPTFVRAWVNVGTAYANTGDFPRAARYYLKALSMVDKRGNSQTGKIDVAHVWEYLRTTFLAMDRDDLIPLIDGANPEAFRTHIAF